MLVELVNKPCTLHVRTDTAAIGELGDAVRETDDIDTLCELQQVESEEPVAAGEASVTTWLVVFADTDLVFNTGDSVTIPGWGDFEFLGDPWLAKQGSPDIWHIEAKARQTA